MSMRTPLGRVRGLGAARDGTHHFWLQRLTALANVPLVIALVVIVVNITAADYAAARAMVASPVVAILLLLLILSVTNHMRIGMQAIIEDYVHADLPKVLAQVLNVLFAIAIAVACSFAILKISFGG